MKRFRERKYPYIVRCDELLMTVHDCEACKKQAVCSIKYETDEKALELSQIFLCKEHEKLTRYGNWKKVFKDIDSKLGKQTSD